MVMRNSTAAAYIVAPETMEQMLASLEDYEDLRDALERLDDVKRGVELASLEDVRQQLGL
jgi:predicted DNA-binding protein